MKVSELKKLTVKELKELAREMGLSGYSKLNKSDLIELIRQGVQKGGATVGAPHSKTYEGFLESDYLANAQPVQNGGDPTGMPLEYYSPDSLQGVRSGWAQATAQKGGNPTGMPLEYFNPQATSGVRSGWAQALMTGGAPKYRRGGTLGERRGELKEKMRRAQSPIRQKSQRGGGKKKKSPKSPKKQGMNKNKRAEKK